MMCDEAELRMAELLAGDIAPAERAALDQHLLDCDSCRGDFAMARAGMRAEWADVPVPKELIEATLASFREPPAAVRFLRWATAAAALVAMAVLLLTSSRAPKPAPVEAARPPAERREVLATMQDAVVGALVCKDEDGRPVGELGLKSHDVTVEILDGIAKTTVEENFENHTDRRLEGTFTFPLPSDASISRLALEVNGKIEEGTCLERERAREVFESIVRRMQDPALLEWQPGGFFKCRVFPIEARSTKRVIVAYTQALPCFRGKMTYVYPLVSEKTRTHPPEELRISLLARFSGALAKIESPSHRLDVQRKNANEASMSFRAPQYRPNNDFVVTMEPADEELRVVTHRPEGEDGYFACFLTPRGGGERAPGRYAFVLDASASISAPRLEVAKRLVRAMMERRIPGDRFEILAHNVEVERGGEVDLRAANDFMDRLRPIGGSDVLKALLDAPRNAELIYIGKGSPSFGEIDPAKILEALKGRRIRTVAVGSDANGLLLEKLGGIMRVSPNDDVDKRVAEIAATLGSPLLTDVKVEGEGLSELVGARDLFYGERLVVSGRYRDGASKLVVSGSGYRRELELAFPAKEEGNNYVRRLWAQRKVADLLARGEATKPEVTALGVKYQIMTPYTSFLVLETEQMWKDHQLKREVQKQDQVLGKQVEDEKKRMAEAESAAHEIQTKRDVTRKMAQLLTESYQAIEQKRYGRAMELCDQILLIDPHYEVAKELKEGAEKSRHTDDAFGVLAGKVQDLKKATENGEQAIIPWSQTVRFPSREEWGEISKRLTSSLQVQASSSELEKIAQELAKGRSAQEQQAIYESQRHYELALMFSNRGDFERAKIEGQKAVEAWYENTAARKLLNDVNRITVGGRAERGARSIAEDARDDFRVRMEQAQIEITKHVRDGQRYYNARMYEHAVKEFENAQFKIENIPYEVKAMNELLPTVQESAVRARNARILENLRTEEEKKRMAEAEASAHEPRRVDDGEWSELVGKLKANYSVSEQGKASQADELYRRAERMYQAGDFEKAVLETQRALQLAPSHAPARALNTEVQFILGQGKATPTTQEYDKFMHEALVRHQQLLIEVDNAFERGKRDYSRGDFAQADREFRKIVEYSKWMPTGVELETRRQAAEDMLRRSPADRGWTMADFPSVDLTLVEPENNGKAARLSELNRQPDAASALASKHDADMQVFARQLEVQLQQIQELTTKVDEHRSKLAKSLNEKSLAVAEMEYARQMAERLQQDLAQLEEKHVEMAREKKHLEEKINAIAQSGGNVNVAPKKALEAKITAVANELGLVVMSIGKDDGVLEGDEFTIYRGGDFVSKIVIDRSDRKWAAGKVVLKKIDARVGDDVSNHIFVSGPRGAALTPSFLDVRAAGDNWVRLKGSASVGQVFAVTRELKFVALIRIEKVSGDEIEARILQNLAVGKVLTGDRADRVDDTAAFLAALPPEVRADLSSRSNQESIRSKMVPK